MVLAATVICGACLFTSCKTDEDNNDLKLEEKIIGKWIQAEINGEPTTTNNKSVLTFVSTTKAYKSASILKNTDWITRWIDKLESDVVINGNKVTLTNHPSENQTAVEEYIISDINANAEYLKYSVKEDNYRWNTYKDYTSSTVSVWMAYGSMVDSMKQWLVARMDWLKKEFDAM